MNRCDIITKIAPVLKDKLLVIAPSLIDETMSLFGTEYLYIDVPNITISIATGVAMGTDNKVFVLVSDNEVLSSISDLYNASVSKCKNLIFLVFTSGMYKSTNTPNILNSLTKFNDISLAINMIVYDYTKHIERLHSYEDLNLLFSNLKGPIIVNIQIKGVVKLH